MSISEPKAYFKSLDCLRFFAFLMVFLQHAFPPAIHVLQTSVYLNTLVNVIRNGSLGVSFFFVLSGFLITHLLLMEKKRTGTVHVGFFYIRRILRIWPLYYAVLIFTLLLYPQIRILLGHEYFEYGYRNIMEFCFLTNFDMINLLENFPGKDSIMVNITWSVAIEEQFYLVWPLLFFFIKEKYYWCIFPVVISGSLIFRLLHMDDGLVLWLHTISVINDMAIGGLAAYSALYYQRFLEGIKALKRIWIIIIYVCGFSLIYLQQLLPVPDWYTSTARILTTAFFAFIILEQNYSQHSFKKYSDWKLLSFLGTLTYGLYLLHQICIHFVSLLWEKLPFHFNIHSAAFMIGFISFLLSFLVSYISYSYFESYFLRLKNKFSFLQPSGKVQRISASAER